MPTNFTGVLCGLSHEKQKDHASSVVHWCLEQELPRRPFRDDEGPSNIAVSGQVLLFVVQPIQPLEGQTLLLHKFQRVRCCMWLKTPG